MEDSDISEIEAFIVEHEDKQLNTLDSDHTQVLEEKAEKYLGAVMDEMENMQPVDRISRLLTVRRKLKKMLEALRI